MMEARRADLAAALLGRATRSTRRSIASSGTRAGPTSSRRCSAGRTRSPARTSTSRSPSRPASSGSSRPDEPRARGARLARSPRRSSAATRSSSSPPSRTRWPRSSSARSLATVGRPRRRRQHPHRPPRGARAVARRAHGRERDRRHRRRRSRRRSSSKLAAENVKRVVRGEPDGAEPVGDRRLPRAEDRLAPDRHLSSPVASLASDRRRAASARRSPRETGSRSSRSSPTPTRLERPRSRAPRGSPSTASVAGVRDATGLPILFRVDALARGRAARPAPTRA